MTYKLIEKDRDIKVPIGKVKDYVDTGLYQYPQKRGFLKIYSDEYLLDIDLVREFTNYDGPIRTNTTFHFTYMDISGYAWPSQPHTDVISCLATHAIPLDSVYSARPGQYWNNEWGGSLCLYNEESIPDDYKEIVPKLNIENPKQEDIDLWNDMKTWGIGPDIEYEMYLTDNESVLFTRDTWHGVGDVQITGLLSQVAYRRILIVNYHKEDMNCAFGD